MAHKKYHNLLGIYMSAAQNLSFIWNFLFLDPVYTCIGTGSMLVYQFSSFLWKGAPSTKEDHICGSVNLILHTNF